MYKTQKKFSLLLIGVDFPIVKLNCVAIRPTFLHLIEAKRFGMANGEFYLSE